MQTLKTKKLLDEETLAERVRELGSLITREYKGEELIIVGVLKGSFIFLADLVRSIQLPLNIEFIGVSSYKGTESSGHVRITQDLTAEIKGANVLLVEDIVDTGLTIDYLIETLGVRQPKSLRVCSLLSKPEAHIMTHKIDYVGFEISTEFVVGYGLDLNDRYRELPYIAQVISD